MLKIIPAVLFAVTIATPAASTLTEREVAYCDHHPGWNGTAEECVIIVQGLWLYCAAHPEAREIGDTQHTLSIGECVDRITEQGGINPHYYYY
jgi:hypothetical protein